MGKQWKTVSNFIFEGSKITADGDCSHEIKRRLLLGRKVMTNLDSIFKSRDITLPTKIRLVKFLSTGFGRSLVPLASSLFTSFHTDALKSFFSDQIKHELLASTQYILHGGMRGSSIVTFYPRSNQSILEISPGCSLEGMILKLKLQYFVHLMRRVDSLEKTLMLGGIGGRRRRGQ